MSQLSETNDLGLVLELAKRLELEFTEDEDVLEGEVTIISGTNSAKEGFTIKFGCGRGYRDCIAEFYFDNNGSLLSHGAWQV